MLSLGYNGYLLQIPAVRTTNSGLNATNSEFVLQIPAITATDSDNPHFINKIPTELSTDFCAILLLLLQMFVVVAASEGLQHVDDITNWKVTKSNELVKAGYTLSLNEQRLILFCIAQIDSRKPFSRIKAVTAAAFAAAYTLETRHAYEALEDATERLWNREVKTRFEDGRVEKVRWVSKATYDRGNGRVTVNFSPEILPFLTLLNERFTSYDLRYISHLTSTYAIRVYEYLKQYVKLRSSIRVTLVDFKEMLELSDSYMRFANFKARILVPAVEQINSHTDLRVSWVAIREQRSVVAIDFRFTKASQQEELPLLPVVEDLDESEAA